MIERIFGKTKTRLLTKKERKEERKKIPLKKERSKHAHRCHFYDHSEEFTPMVVNLLKKKKNSRF